VVSSGIKIHTVRSGREDNVFSVVWQNLLPDICLVMQNVM